jgi:hypothetical protein
MCEGPDSYEGEDSIPWYLEQHNIHGFFHLYVTTHNGRRYSFTLTSAPSRSDAARLDYNADVEGWSTALIFLVAGADCVRFVSSGLPVSLIDLESFVSREPPRGGRTIDYNDIYVGAESARIVASRTHRDTELVVRLNQWCEHVVALEDALRANQCPKRLVLKDTSLFRINAAPGLADAIRGTSAVEAITIELSQRCPEYVDNCNMLLEAIASNDGIRSVGVKVRHYESVKVDRVKEICSIVLMSRTIERVDVSGVEAENCYTDAERRDCALHVISLLRSNRVVTQLLYNTGTHDSQIMDTQVGPLLDFNRIRPFVESLNAAGTAAERKRTLSLLFGAPFVGRRSWLLFCLVKSFNELVIPLQGCGN